MTEVNDETKSKINDKIDNFKRKKEEWHNGAPANAVIDQADTLISFLADLMDGISDIDFS